MIFAICFEREGITLKEKYSFISLLIHVYSDESIWGNLISRSHLMNFSFIWANLL